MKKVIEVEFVKSLETSSWKHVELYRGNDDKYYVADGFTQFGDYKAKKGYEVIESKVVEVDFKCDLSEVNSYLDYEIVNEKVYADFIVPFKLYTINRKTETIIDKAFSFKEAEELIEKYETEDRKNGIYESDRYDILDIDKNSLLY